MSMSPMWASSQNVDGEVEFGGDELGVVGEADPGDERGVVGGDEQGQGLGEAFEEYLLLGVD